MEMEGEAGLIIPGMRFVPDEHELLLFYLTKKTRGEPLPWVVGIRDFDVYGERGPWEMLHYGGETSSSSSEPVYVFAISKNKSAKMKQRTCDFGTWKLQKNNTPVYYQNRIIGSRAYLSFMPKKGVDPRLLGGNWNMTEYSLPGSEDKDCYVICKVSFKVWTEKERSKRALKENMSPAMDPTRPEKRAKAVICGGSNNWEPAPPVCASSYPDNGRLDLESNNLNPCVAPYPSNGDLGSNNNNNNVVDEYLNSSSNAGEEAAGFDSLMDRGVAVQRSNIGGQSTSSYLFCDTNQPETADASILESNTEESRADDPLLNGNNMNPFIAPCSTDDDILAYFGAEQAETSVDAVRSINTNHEVEEIKHLESTDDDIIAYFGAKMGTTTDPISDNGWDDTVIHHDFMTTALEEGDGLLWYQYNDFEEPIANGEGFLVY